MKVLISAFACIPDHGSEPGIGWQWVSRISQFHEVHVITTQIWRAQIESSLQASANPRLTFHYLKFWNVPEGTLRWIGYYAWQWRVARAAMRLHDAVGFDICHHVTYGTIRVPSFLWRIRIPFVFGPVGGAQVTPKGFASTLGICGFFADTWRNLCQAASSRDPLVRLCMAKANSILCVNRDTVRRVPLQYRFKTKMVSPSGIDVVKQERRMPRGERLEILWAGRIVPWKGLALLLRAISSAKVPAHLTVLGAGSDRRRCERLARSLKVDASFLGWVPNEKMGQFYGSADMFAFTSLRESFAMVVIEAMAAGLPLMLIDCGGALEIPNDCAVKVTPCGSSKTEALFATAIKWAFENPERLSEIGEAGRRHAETHYAWNVMLEERLTAYESLAGRCD